MAEWRKVIVSGSNAELNQLQVSTSITASTVSASRFTGSLFGTASWANNATNASTASWATNVNTASWANNATNASTASWASNVNTASWAISASHVIGGGGIFVNQGSYYNTQNTLQITGSTLQSSPSSSGTGTASVSTGTSNAIYSLLTSESIYSFNHNVGYPNANSWKVNLQCSYFNSFDANTNVSEILRFIAGLLSQSAPSPLPNTKTFNDIIPLSSNFGTSSILGRIPSESTNSDILYLRSKGFANSGSASFDLPYVLGRVYSSSDFSFTYSSSVGGSSTVVSSSNDLQLFGLGEKGDSATLSSSIVYKFFSSSNESTPTFTSTVDRSIYLAGTNPLGSDGFNKYTISTANLAVIPSQYQDGKFTGSFTSAYNPVTFAGPSNPTISPSGSTGWYHFSQSITLYTGSQTSGLVRVNNIRVFRSAYSQSSFPTNTINHIPTVTQLTAISRSLSGAPYLTQSSYLYLCTSSGIFNPMYSTTASLYRITTGSNFITKSSGNHILTIDSLGRIGSDTMVYSSSNSTVSRGANAYPSQNDIIRVTASYFLTPTEGASGSAQIAFTVGNTSSFISASTFNRLDTLIASGTVLTYFTPGTFGQLAASGTMALYNRPQGYDPGLLTSTSEIFQGETYRLQITDSLLSGSYASGSKFVTNSFVVNNLGSKDLQVKPSYLVYPGGTYKYWLPDPSPAQVYKYYARAFKQVAAASSLTLTVGQALIPWTSSANGIAVGFIFSSSGIPALATPRLYDPVDTSANFIETTVNDNFKNPFNTSISIYGNINATSPVSNIYTLPLRSADEMRLNGTSYLDFVLLIRYKGDPVPVSSSILTFSS